MEDQNTSTQGSPDPREDDRFDAALVEELFDFDSFVAGHRDRLFEGD